MQDLVLPSLVDGDCTQLLSIFERAKSGATTQQEQMEILNQLNNLKRNPRYGLVCTSIFCSNEVSLNNRIFAGAQLRACVDDSNASVSHLWSDNQLSLVAKALASLLLSSPPPNRELARLASTMIAMQVYSLGLEELFDSFDYIGHLLAAASNAPPELAETCYTTALHAVNDLLDHHAADALDVPRVGHAADIVSLVIAALQSPSVKVASVAMSVASNLIGKFIEPTRHSPGESAVVDAIIHSAAPLLSHSAALLGTRLLPLWRNGDSDVPEAAAHGFRVVSYFLRPDLLATLAPHAGGIVDIIASTLTLPPPPPQALAPSPDPASDPSPHAATVPSLSSRATTVLTAAAELLHDVANCGDTSRTADAAAPAGPPCGDAAAFVHALVTASTRIGDVLADLVYHCAAEGVEDDDVAVEEFIALIVDCCTAMSAVSQSFTTHLVELACHRAKARDLCASAAGLRLLGVIVGDPSPAIHSVAAPHIAGALSMAVSRTRCVTAAALAAAAQRDPASYASQVHLGVPVEEAVEAAVWPRGVRLFATAAAWMVGRAFWYVAVDANRTCSDPAAPIAAAVAATPVPTIFTFLSNLALPAPWPTGGVGAAAGGGVGGAGGAGGAGVVANVPPPTPVSVAALHAYGIALRQTPTPIGQLLIADTIPTVTSILLGQPTLDAVTKSWTGPFICAYIDQMQRFAPPLVDATTSAPDPRAAPFVSLCAGVFCRLISLWGGGAVDAPGVAGAGDVAATVLRALHYTPDAVRHHLASAQCLERFSTDILVALDLAFRFFSLYHTALTRSIENDRGSASFAAVDTAVRMSDPSWRPRVSDYYVLRSVADMVTLLLFFAPADAVAAFGAGVGPYFVSLLGERDHALTLSLLHLIDTLARHAVVSRADAMALINFIRDEGWWVHLTSQQAGLVPSAALIVEEGLARLFNATAPPAM